MIIVVNDANILIDLVKLQILSPFFDLDFQFCTTDLVLEELHDHQKTELEPYIDSGQLQVQEISEEQLIEIIKIRMERPSLSEQDCSAFYQAQHLKATLITSDNTLRKFAKIKNLDVHGHLWVFDQMVIAQTLSPALAAFKLDELCDSINPKLNLPRKECELRRNKWQAD
jgi:predicted nucleic acid-binding protein